MTGLGAHDIPLRADELNSNFVGAPFTFVQRNGTEIIGRLARVVTYRPGGPVEVWLEGYADSEDDTTGHFTVGPDEVFHIPPRSHTWEFFGRDE